MRLPDGRAAGGAGVGRGAGARQSPSRGRREQLAADAGAAPTPSEAPLSYPAGGLAGALSRAIEPLKPGLNASPLPSAVASRTGRYVFANHAYCQLLGRDLARLQELSVADVTHVEDVERDRRALRALAAGQLREHHIRKRYVRVDGSSVEAFTHVGPIIGENGRPIGLVAHVIDAADHPTFEDWSARDGLGFRMLFANNPQPMCICDIETLRFLAVNDAACTQYGYTRRQFRKLTIADIRPPEDRLVLRAHLASANPSTHVSGSWRHLRADGSIIEVEVASREIVYEGRDAVLVSLQDVTDRNRLDRELAQSMLRDPVSGLPNRALFLDRLSQSLIDSGGRPGFVGVLYVDLDSFALINESLGHEAGDQMLAALGERLTERLPDGCSAGRIAGDEIAVYAVGLPGRASVLQLARHLQEIIGEPFCISERTEVHLTACVGVMIPSEQCGDAATLVRNAALAVEQAKRAGTGQVACLDEHSLPSERRRSVGARHELRTAIETGQIEVHYQPVVSLSEQAIVGVEALARWRHPQRGLVSPEEFIPVAEETGLIVPLDRVVLQQACRDAAVWPELGPEGMPFAVSVNISARQLGEERVTRLVADALRETGLNPRRLALEITETVLIDYGEAVVAQLAQVRSLGVHLALDDFGSGYSSLSQLDRVPFNVVKLDRSFVTGMTSNSRRQSIVASVLRLAEDIGLHVVAEGVESDVEEAVLIGLGARFAQGFYYHRPMCASRLRAHLWGELSTPRADTRGS